MNSACTAVPHIRIFVFEASSVAGNRRGFDIVRELFANATAARLNVVRLYAHTTDPDHPFQVSPRCAITPLVL